MDSLDSLDPAYQPAWSPGSSVTLDRRAASKTPLSTPSPDSGSAASPAGLYPPARLEQHRISRSPALLPFSPPRAPLSSAPLSAPSSRVPFAARRPQCGRHVSHAAPGSCSASGRKSRKQATGPPEVEAHKDEILGLYSTSTNKTIRNLLSDKYNIKITEKQLKRVLRLWKAYKNTRGVRKATIKRKNRPRRTKVKKRSGTQRPLRVPTPTTSDSEDNDDVEEIDRSREFSRLLSPEYEYYEEFSPISPIEDDLCDFPDMELHHLHPDSPVVSMRSPTFGGSDTAPGIPQAQVPASSPFVSQHSYIFNSPLMPAASPVRPLSSQPFFPILTPSSPSAIFTNCKDKITRQSMEAIQRFNGVYKLSDCPDADHWTAYSNLQNTDEQRLRQGILIAQASDDRDMLEESLTSSIVPMFKKMDLLAVVGLIAIFASLTKKEFLTALLHHLRTNLYHVPKRERKFISDVIDCFRDLLHHHKWDADVFHKDLRDALSGLGPYIRATIGRRSLVGTHLIFLMVPDNSADIVQETLAEEQGSSNTDVWTAMATRYLVAGKLFFSAGIHDPFTRHHVDECYKMAERLKNELIRGKIDEDHEWLQDTYHYLCRVGLWKVQCESRQRTPDGYYGAEPEPPVALLERSILYGELCHKDGPQSPIVIQALGKLRGMYAGMKDDMKTEMTTLRIQAVHARRSVTKGD